MAKEPSEPAKEPIPGIDFFVSIIILVLSTVVFVWSFQMPRPGGWSTAPGLMPLFLAVTLFAMGIGLMTSALRNNGIAALRTRMHGFSFRSWVNEATGRRTLWILLLTTVYIFVLLGRIPFEIASMLFLLATLFVFWKNGSWLRIVLFSVFLPLVLGIIFRGVFVILLPGGSLFDLILR